MAEWKRWLAGRAPVIAVVRARRTGHVMTVSPGAPDDLNTLWDRHQDVVMRVGRFWERGLALLAKPKLRQESGFCPGPAVAALSTGLPPVIVFVAAMAVGMAAHGVLRRLRPSR